MTKYLENACRKSGSVSFGGKIVPVGGGPADLSVCAQKRTEVNVCLYSAVIHKVESTTKLFATV